MLIPTKKGKHKQTKGHRTLLEQGFFHRWGKRKGEKKGGGELCFGFFSPFSAPSPNESWQADKTKNLRREQTCQTP